jgi:glucoamylase
MLRATHPGTESSAVHQPASTHRRVGRTLTITLVVVALGLATGSASLSIRRESLVKAYAHGAGVALRADGQRVVLPNGARASALIPGSRVLLPPPEDPTATAAERLAAAQRAWVEAGTVPGTGTRWESMTRDALLDMRTLTPATGGTAAGWASSWRYVWPRDASFVAVAFAQTHHLTDAERELAYLQQVQGPSGLFEARYVLDGSGPPDERWVQSDSTGWVLWATRQVASTVSPLSARRAVTQRLRQLITRSTTALLLATDVGRRLPPPSPDYREVPEDSVTLGTVGPFLAGLEAAGPLARLLGDPRAKAVEVAAARFRATVTAAFAPDYPRTVKGDALDAAVTFLLPPFTTYALPGSLTAAAVTEERLHRPAGGVAPGTDWKDDVISWTPETALFALTAAATGDRTSAERGLDWLNAHRTGVGALPERVDGEGRAAGPAPLAWTDALVLLTVAALDPTD